MRIIHFHHVVFQHDFLAEIQSDIRNLNCALYLTISFIKTHGRPTELALPG